jgi:hypothetical protein
MVGIHDPIWHDEQERQPTRRRPRRHPFLLVAIAAFAVGCYCLVATFLSRQDYGTFAFWGVPSRIDYCGRRYLREGTERGTPSEFTGEGAPSAESTWQTVGHTFSLRPIQAPVAGHRGFSSVCTMTVYVPVGGGRFAMYSLSGGP